MCSKGNAVECQTATVRTSFPGCDCAVLALRRIGFSSLNTAVHVGGTQDRSRSELSVLPFEVLCCRQHKPTYVAQRFMWARLGNAPKDTLFGVDKRHITFRSETAKELHDAWVLAPHLSLVPFPAGVRPPAPSLSSQDRLRRRHWWCRWKRVPATPGLC